MQPPPVDPIDPVDPGEVSDRDAARGGGPLPRTGSDSFGLVRLGLLLLAAGVTLTALGRRRLRWGGRSGS